MPLSPLSLLRPRLRSAIAAVVASLTVATVLALAGTGAARASGPGYRVRSAIIAVHVGPGHVTTCDVVYDLYVPDAASATHPVPAILTTNGFGGSKADQAPLGEYFAAPPRNYVVLSYSGLGFGGSGCNIELDDPQWDGAAASQIISFLGQLPEVQKDGPDDPRVGMIGGSYGGDVQFSTAEQDPRLDTIVPIITWNDLAYSLAPNNDAADFVHTDAVPGVVKAEWAGAFFADGLTSPLTHPATTPVPPSACPGFDLAVCEAAAETFSLGYPTPFTLAFLRHTSMVTYYRRIHVPVMLMQGQADTLFNINEAVANFHELLSDHVPVKLVLQSWGHSQSTPAPGEVSYTSTAQGYETLLIQDWFAKYLKHQDVSTGPLVEYFRDWVSYNHSGSAEPAYGTSAHWPAARTVSLYLSGGNALVGSRRQVRAGSQTFANPAGAEPASYSETSAFQDQEPFSSIPPSDPPGTFASWSTAPLAANVDSVGVPVVRFRLTSAVPPGADPAADPVLFGKLYDVAPNGTLTLVQRLVSPIRIADTSRPVTLTLPGVVHRYPAGHRIELVLASTDQAYLGSKVPNLYTVAVNPAQPSILDLPVVAAAQETSGGPRATGG